MANDWLLWQLADSAFPAGSFAHSGGLEAAWQHGRVRRGESLAAFLETAMTQAAHATLPFVLSVHAEPERFVDFDALCDATLSNHVANRASRLQGQSLLAGVERILRNAAITSLQASTRSARAPTHFGPVFGAVTAFLACDRIDASRLFLFCTLRGMVSSAVRLGIVGPMEAQSLQAALAGSAERLANAALDSSADDAAQTAPILDLLQGTQDRLYSRLFQI